MYTLVFSNVGPSSDPQNIINAQQVCSENVSSVHPPTHHKCRRNSHFPKSTSPRRCVHVVLLAELCGVVVPNGLHEYIITFFFFFFFVRITKQRILIYYKFITIWFAGFHSRPMRVYTLQRTCDRHFFLSFYLSPPVLSCVFILLCTRRHSTRFFFFLYSLHNKIYIIFFNRLVVVVVFYHRRGGFCLYIRSWLTLMLCCRRNPNRTQSPLEISRPVRNSS